MTVKNYSYRGSGILHVKRRGASEPRRDVGNCSQLEIAAEEEERNLPNYRGGGGNYDAERTISSVTAQITLHDFSPENLEMALRGSISEVSAGTVTGEEHTAYVGALTPFDFLPDFSDTEGTLTVTLDPGGTPSEAEEGTDFTVTASGIIPIEGGAIADESTIEVDYTKRASAVISALMGSAQDWEMFFEGLNESKGGNPVTVLIKRGRFGAPENLGFISEEYAGLQMTADVLADVNAAAGTSAFFDVAMARLDE